MLQEGGHLRFLAPELSDGRAEKFRTSPESDIFSLSMTFLNILTRHPPLNEMKNDLKVAAEFRKGRRPARPIPSSIPLMANVEEEFWTLLGNMWAPAPLRRPSSRTVRDKVEGLLQIWLQPGLVVSTCTP